MKWAGLVSSLMLLIAMALSFEWNVSSLFPWLGYRDVFPVQCSLNCGAISFTAGAFQGLPYREPKGWDVTCEISQAGLGLNNHWLPHLLRPRFNIDRSRGENLFIHVPLPPVIVVLAAGTAFLWYHDRRIPPGHCKKCGYNLTGNVSGICPECGRVIPTDVETKVRN